MGVLLGSTVPFGAILWFYPVRGGTTIQPYPIPAFIFFVPAAIALGSQIKPRYRELSLSVFVVTLIWGVNNILRKWDHLL